MGSTTPQALVQAFESRVDGRTAGLTFDYDGTIVDLHDHPGQAALDRATRKALFRLTDAPRVRTALVTGRDLPGLTAVAGVLPGVAMITNGGLRMDEDGSVWVHTEAQALAPELESLRWALEPATRAFPGAWIEWKTLSFTVHFRLCPDAAPALRSATREAVAGHGGRFRLLETKHGVEVQPNVEWDKGRALIRLFDHWGVGTACLYLGDDVIDEAAFAAVRQRGGVTCRIGPESKTAAEWSLASVGDVRELLGLLAAVIA